VSFVKMDVEGAEPLVWKAHAGCSPPIADRLSEVHGAQLAACRP